LNDIWIISAASIWVQALANLWFLRRELRSKLSALSQHVNADESLHPVG
jgi:hypothetical protein